MDSRDHAATLPAVLPDISSPVTDGRTDRELMCRLRTGDHSCLVELAARYGSDLHATALRAGCDHHAAEDVVQDTFLAVLRYALSYDPSRPVRAWLRVIAVNCARTRLRKDGWLSVSADLPEPVDGTDALDAMAETELAAVLRSATWDLDPKSRDAIRLCYLGGLTHAQIARQMRCTVGRVSGLIRRAREELRLRLAGRFGEG